MAEVLSPLALACQSPLTIMLSSLQVPLLSGPVRSVRQHPRAPLVRSPRVRRDPPLGVPRRSAPDVGRPPRVPVGRRGAAFLGRAHVRCVSTRPHTVAHAKSGGPRGPVRRPPGFFTRLSESEPGDPRFSESSAKSAKQRSNHRDAADPMCSVFSDGACCCVATGARRARHRGLRLRGESLL